MWIGLKFAPGGNNALFPLLNSFVHTAMYLYYGLAAFGPHMQKYLWWKRYLTKIQMLQFSIVIVHGLRTLFMNDCHFPISFLILSQFNAILFLALFYSFYSSAYRKKPDQKKPRSTNQLNNNSIDVKDLNRELDKESTKQLSKDLNSNSNISDRVSAEGQIRECKKIN